jgi:nicotinate phosphoribosyltransferase
MEPGSSPLLTDLYQLNMIEAYLADSETKTAVFELFVRKLPDRRGFLMAAGLEQALEFLEELRFSSDEIDWLKGTKSSARTLDISPIFATGDVHAIVKGRLSSPMSRSCA